jgi:competence protein ComEC
MTLVYLAIGWLLGIVAADLHPLPLPLLQSAAALGALVAAGLARRPRLRLAALLLCCAALGGWRYAANQPTASARSVRLLSGRGAATIVGAVQGDPKRTEEGQQVIVRVEAARLAGRSVPAQGLVLLTLPPYPQYHYGQRLLAMGELLEPRAAARPGEFDYRAYLARKGIFAISREPLVRVQPGETGNPALRALLVFRDRCKTVLLRALPEPQASIAVGVLLGLQSSIPDDTYNTFSVTGTSHILVVSGWNFTIVAAVVASVAARARFGRGAAFWLSMLVLWSYAFFVGPTGTVLRAAVMASLVVVARSVDRRTEPWTLLFAACWALTLYDPNTLWDLGFQLSALATASLFAFGRPVEAWLQRCPPLRWPALGWAAEALTATLAAQILALPIILYQFGNLSLIAPLANILLVPVVPYTMLLGTVALVGGLVWLPLGQLLAVAVWLPLSWLTEGARLLSQVPWAAVQLPPFPLWLLLGYYTIVVGGWLWGARPAGIASDALSSHQQLAH